MKTPCLWDDYADPLAHLIHSQPKMSNSICEGLSHDRSRGWVPRADTVDTRS